MGCWVKIIAAWMATLTYFLPVPLTPQQTDHTCGPASIKAVMAYYGVAASEEALAKLVHCSRAIGTDFPPMQEGLKTLGWESRLRKNATLGDLIESLKNKIPPLVVIQGWGNAEGWANGHYVVVVGIDDERVVVMDPLFKEDFQTWPISDFLTRWHGNDAVLGPLSHALFQIFPPASR